MGSLWSNSMNATTKPTPERSRAHCRQGIMAVFPSASGSGRRLTREVSMMDLMTWARATRSSSPCPGKSASKTGSCMVMSLTLAKPWLNWVSRSIIPRQRTRPNHLRRRREHRRREHRRREHLTKISAPFSQQHSKCVPAHLAPSPSLALKLNVALFYFQGCPSWHPPFTVISHAKWMSFQALQLVRRLAPALTLLWVWSNTTCCHSGFMEPRRRRWACRR